MWTTSALERRRRGGGNAVGRRRDRRVRRPGAGDYGRAEQVDLVSHSTGRLLAGYYVKVLGGSAQVDNLIALTPVWKGNEAYGAGVALDVMDQLGIRDRTLAVWDPICPARLQMAKGSDFMNEITDGGPYAPGVKYTNG